MKQLAIAVLLALAGLVLACGHSNIAEPTQTNTSGNWEAQLIGGTDETALLNFIIQFNVTNTNGQSAEPLSVTGISFINLNTCFVTESAAGSADLTTNTENQVTGTMSFTVQSQTPPGMTMTLNGTNVQGSANNGALTNGIVTGTWSLTGNTSCTGSGTFTMCQNAPSCTTN